MKNLIHRHNEEAALQAAFDFPSYVADRLRTRLETAQLDINEYIKRCTENGIEYASHFFEDSLKAAIMFREYSNWLNWITRDEEPASHEALVAYITSTIDELTNQLLTRDGFRHNSTSAVDNIKNIQEWKAKQSYLSFWKSLMDFRADALEYVAENTSLANDFLAAQAEIKEA